MAILKTNTQQMKRNTVTRIASTIERWSNGHTGEWVCVMVMCNIAPECMTRWTLCAHPTQPCQCNYGHLVQFDKFYIMSQVMKCLVSKRMLKCSLNSYTMVFFAFEANIILNLQKQKALPEEIWYRTEKWGDMFTTVWWKYYNRQLRRRDGHGEVNSQRSWWQSLSNKKRCEDIACCQGPVQIIRFKLKGKYDIFYTQ